MPKSYLNNLSVEIIFVIIQNIIGKYEKKYINYFSQKVIFSFIFFIIIKMATGCHEIFETVNVFANISSIVCFLISLKKCFFLLHPASNHATN